MNKKNIIDSPLEIPAIGSKLHKVYESIINDFHSINEVLKTISPELKLFLEQNWLINYQDLPEIHFSLEDNSFKPWKDLKRAVNEFQQTHQLKPQDLDALCDASTNFKTIWNQEITEVMTPTGPVLNVVTKTAEHAWVAIAPVPKTTKTPDQNLRTVVDFDEINALHQESIPRELPPVVQILELHQKLKSQGKL